MKYKIIITALIAAMALLAVLYDFTLTPASNKAPDNNETTYKISPAPDFSFTTINDERLKLSDFKGKIIILNFWASWCAPCLKEFPAMMELVNKFNGSVIFIGVSKDSGLDDIKRFLKKTDKEQTPDFVKILWDSDKHISENIFYVMRLPETIIIDKDMNMRRKIIGNPDIWESPEIYEYIKSLE